MSLSKILCLTTIAISCSAIATTAQAESLDRELSNFVSGPGTIIFLGTGVALPLLTNPENGGQQSLRALDSLATSGLLCFGLKEVTSVQRPDSEERDSFPSCHATASFAVATVQSHYNPDAALLWYGGATLISASRVNLNRHRLPEVLAGAALGYFTAKLELSQKRGLILFPLIKHDPKGDSVVGLQVVGSF